MDWTQVLAIVGSNLALMVVSMGSTITLFLWARSEARSDYEHLDKKIDVMKDLIATIQLEMKDFHNKICNIEESRK